MTGKFEYVKIGAPDIEGVFRGKRVALNILPRLAGGWLCAVRCALWLGYRRECVAQPQIQQLGARLRRYRDEARPLYLRDVPWEENVASCICDLWTEHGEPVTISPRYVLNNLVERARALGFEPMAASELEFRFFRENQVSLRDKDFGPNLTPLNPGMNCYAISQASADDHLLGRIARMMRDHGVEIEGYNREHGPGMYEMNIHYADALTAGDRTMLFKTGVKEICHQMGLTG